MEKTNDEAELVVDVTDLATTYLGAFSFASLANAARVVEVEPGSIARADALFRTPTKPWCPEIF